VYAVRWMNECERLHTVYDDQVQLQLVLLRYGKSEEKQQSPPLRNPSDLVRK